MVQEVQFVTRDRVKIAADYYSPDVHSSRGVVLVHMMPATRKSWQNFAGTLEASGYQALAIDLRGHGDSGGGNFREFFDADHQASIRDLEAAGEYLEARGVSDIFTIGASIGANLALQYLGNKPRVAGAVLLSPGVDYRGLDFESLARRVRDKSRVLFVGAEDDVESMGESCQKLASEFGFIKSVCYPHGGHGTNLLQTHPELSSEILKFFSTL